MTFTGVSIAWVEIGRNNFDFLPDAAMEIVSMVDATVSTELPQVPQEKRALRFAPQAVLQLQTFFY